MEILSKAPWNMMGCLFNIVAWDNFKNLNELSFTKAKFQVQVHNMPMDVMNDENARKLGAKLGKVIKIDLPFVEKECDEIFLQNKGPRGPFHSTSLKRVDQKGNNQNGFIVDMRSFKIFVFPME